MLQAGIPAPRENKGRFAFERLQICKVRLCQIAESCSQVYCCHLSRDNWHHSGASEEFCVPQITQGVWKFNQLWEGGRMKLLAWCCCCCCRITAWCSLFSGPRPGLQVQQLLLPLPLLLFLSSCLQPATRLGHRSSNRVTALSLSEMHHLNDCQVLTLESTLSSQLPPSADRRPALSVFIPFLRKRLLSVVLWFSGPDRSFCPPEPWWLMTDVRSSSEIAQLEDEYWSRMTLLKAPADVGSDFYSNVL